MLQDREEKSVRINRRVILSVTAIVLACFASGFALLTYFARELDRSELDHSRRLVFSSFESQRASMRTTIVDYAAWGEAYQHMHKSFDFDWAYGQQNLGSSLYSDFGFDYILLFDGSGREVYTVVGGGWSSAPVAGQFSPDLQALVAKARGAAVHQKESVPVIGYATVGKEPVVLAAAIMSPGPDPTVEVTPGPASVLVFGNALEPEELQKMGERLFIQNLRADAAADGQPATLAVPQAGDIGKITFTWDLQRPGATLLSWLLPVFVLAAGLGLATVVVLLRHGLKASLQLLQSAADLREARARAEHQALHDVITGLPNRLRLTSYLDSQLRRPELSIALLFMDLDRFKAVNDSLGHSAGDHVLREVGLRLLEIVPNEGLVARIGGDEFVAAVPLTGSESLESLCRSIQRAVARPLSFDGTDISIGISIGIARAPLDAETTSELMRKADIALYQAKGDGRGTYRYFAKEMNGRILARRRLETDLRRAIDQKEFILHFQPRVSARDLTLLGVEALVRWNHPERGLLMPGEFIGAAEETGLIIPLGAWILKEACQAMASLPGLTVSVNVSPVQFRAYGLARTVANVLTATGLAPERLELELTESVLLEDTDRAKHTLQDLKALGVRLAMDDFGTGYSSLSYLKALPFDTIKIDRQFISDLENDGDARAIVQAIISLGRALNLEVVAEGVETNGQLLLLRADQCHEIQGFLTGRPASYEDLMKSIFSPSATQNSGNHVA